MAAHSLEQQKLVLPTVLTPMDEKRLDSLRPIVGTVAHNRAFTYADLEEHCYFRFPRVACSPGTLQGLVRRGLVERLEARKYTPTEKGWEWINQRP
jgi:hypothetical protein